MLTRLVVLVSVILWSAAAVAETASVRLRGSRFVAGVEQRILCSTYDGNQWHRDGNGVRRFVLDPSCPLAADLAGVTFSGREDPITSNGLPRYRDIVVATTDGPLRGAVSGELRRLSDGHFSSERGTLVYHFGAVIFAGEYRARCAGPSPCTP
jgi:hypothetical protein